MLEWVTSKVVISIAALLILSAVGGFFIIQKDSFKDQELSQISKNIGRVIDQVSMINAETSVAIHFDDGSEGIVFPSTIEDEKYIIEIERDQVKCIIGDEKPVTSLHNSVHLFSPDIIDLTNSSQVRNLDLVHPKLRTQSDGNIIIIRTSISAQGSLDFATFIFKEG